MRRLLLLIPLFAAQMLSVEKLSEVAIWRQLAERSAGVANRAREDGDNATLEGQVAFMAEAHTRLWVEYGQLPDLAAVVAHYRFWRDAALITAHRVGIALDGRLEGDLTRISFPHDPLLGGLYQHWILSVANLTGEVIPPLGWEVRLHLRDGTVITPGEPSEPALAGTTAAARPGRHLWREVLYPDTNTRIILLLPPVEQEEVLALEFTLDGTTVWIPWWENIS